MATVTLGSKAVGSIVKLKENGVLVDYIVVHQGLPSSVYDASCDGVWLLRKEIAENRVWEDSNVNKLESSDIQAYFNGTWLNRYDANIKAAIKQVKIPYRKNGGSGGTTQNGANGLSCKVFFLSGPEVNYVHSYIDKGEGAVLDYFKGCATSGADSKRVAYLNGSAANWGLRSPIADNTNNVWYVCDDGRCSSWNTSNSCGVRPALILPSNLLVSDDGSVSTNTAPTTPASIDVPSNIQGGTSINVTWSAATDTENNLEGYTVEKSTDGGSTWTQIYQGSALTTTNSVAFSTDTVMYRVRAYDAGGLYSGWRNSAQVAVINNTAPTPPGSITVPETVLGGAELSVSWTASADSEGNLAGYALERKVDAGAWAEIFRGDALSFTDTVTKGWLSVAYRVRAFDGENAYSGYTEGPSRTVDNNTAPAITCDAASGSDLGTKAEGFSIGYSVGDKDGDAVTVKEAVDGKELRSFGTTEGVENTLALGGLDFQTLLNGTHTLTIAASDGKAETVHRLTFTKTVTEASVTLKTPFAADAKITICVVSVAGDIPADAEYKVEVTNNGKDDTPVWEDCTAQVKTGGNHVFENQTAANGPAFNFRVHVKRGASGQGGYINSVQGGFQ